MPVNFTVRHHVVPHPRSLELTLRLIPTSETARLIPTRMSLTMMVTTRRCHLLQPA
jgi:hypothetical protein